MMPITDLTPNGTESVVANTAFIGHLDSISPAQINGQNVVLPLLPTGTALVAGQLVGRNIDATSGSRTWEYTLDLPPDAQPGTGLSDIEFQARAFERRTNNLENADQLLWELYINNRLVARDGPPAGSDWSTYSLTLADPGGNLVTTARVVFSVTDFDGSGEWFATAGRLSGLYQTPEPDCHWASLVCAVLVCRRRKSKR